MNIAIRDDQKDYLNLLERRVKEYYTDDLPMNLYTFENGESFINSLDERGYNLVFIEMTTDNNRGIEIANELASHCPSCMIIFISDKPRRVREAFHYNTEYYLLKPLNSKEFKKIFLNAVSTYKSKDIHFFIGTSKGVHTLLKISDIKFVQTYYHDLEIMTHDRFYRSDVKQRYNIRPVLKPRHFLQVNQSVLVNMDCIDFLTEKCVILKTREVFNISYKRTIEIHMKYEEYLKNKRGNNNENSDM